MSADPRTELKYKEETDLRAESVKLVTSDQPTSERPTVEHKQTQQASEQEESHSSDVILDAYSEPANLPGMMTYSLGNCYPHSTETPRSTFFPDFKQVLNCAYFTAATLASAELVHAFDLTMFYALTFLFATFAAGAFVYSICQRAHLSDFNVTFSNRTRRAIRATALLIPIPIILAAVCTRISAHEVELAEKAYAANSYTESVDHLNLAIRFNPLSEGAYEGLSRVYYAQSRYDLALANAVSASGIDPNDSYGWTDQARPLLSMGRLAEGVAAAEKAIKLDPKNGQAFSTLADLQYEAGKYELALEAAQKHISLHSNEPYAYELRTKILEKLGQ